jgi:hypothetical protein
VTPPMFSTKSSTTKPNWKSKNTQLTRPVL